MAPHRLSGFFKRGSPWAFGITRKDGAGAGVAIADLQARMMFRPGGTDGEVSLTLATGDGLAASETVVGRTDVTVSGARTLLFPAETAVFFDLELSDTGPVWQSPTFYLVAEAAVTHD